MLKKTITYEDFDGNTTTETLHFNITKTELADNLDLAEELRELETMLEGEERSLTTLEIRQILNLVKRLAKLAYGVRSEDGKRFIKEENTWTEFTQTAGYDAFLFGLFENPELAMEFLMGIIPKDLREQAEASVNNGQESMKFNMPEETPKKLEDYTDVESLEAQLAAAKARRQQKDE